MSLNHYRADYELPKVLTEEVGDELDIRLIEWQVDEDRHLDASCEASLTVSYHANCAGWRSFADTSPLSWREDHCCLFHSTVPLQGVGFVPAGTRWRGVNISFAAHRLGMLDLATQLFEYDGPWEKTRTVDSAARLAQFPAPHVVRRIGQEMLGCRLEGVARDLLLRGKAYEMLGQLTAHIQDLARFTGLSAGGRDLARVERARKLLEAHPEQDWTIESLAQCVELNTKKLKQGFRDVYDSGVYGYLQKVRIERAAQLLKQRGSVSEVAAAVGYSNASHFAKVFRRYYGINPLHFSTLAANGIDEVAIRAGVDPF
ncbi:MULTISPECIES: helix-turn-helix transcriptional regulator [Pseudomonas]|uniref:AraC family transcriptional regulator n=1 Tax=Pseudomonas cichorii TaxID=36746 RepID=A0ABQ1DHC8_PSECI|nr:MULTISPECIES: AraC family transcriptional regulator [Pseudomonas]AHF67327.1 AraC family transcriptional regulator [Pseudomonas cichorii JBC1]QVE19190.1 helix-turn-helix transcriptional regulator [Pseudomonas cichorii]SDN52599.1 transcriptional regulator, AraC family [Pseudomonas cichorii]GFM75373.1 AraC family transcriptional regulator [Pseudomonas cichorii]GFM90384.1 AraC family transcriptional regulator [Pseudomonas cichorii]